MCPAIGIGGCVVVSVPVGEGVSIHKDTDRAVSIRCDGCRVGGPTAGEA